MENIQKQNPIRIEKKSGFLNKVFSMFGFRENNQNKANDQIPYANDKTMWIPDEKAQTCYNCRKEFSAIFLRKHHCRICGNVFCKECSSKTVEGKYWGSKKEIKVCEYCYKMYQKLDETLIETTCDNANNLTDEINSINDNMKNLKRETKLSEYCKFSKKDFEECVKFLQMDKKLEEPVKLNLENYFDLLLKQIIENVFKIEGINEKWVDKIFEITKKAIHQVNPSFRDLKDYLNINEYMKIKTIYHKDISFCKVIDGFAFQKNVCTKSMNTNIENPKILLLDCGLDYYRNNDITDFENLKLQEPAYFNIIMKKIELVEPNVILVNKNISRKIQEYLSHSNKISLVINVKSSSLKRIARCTKTYVLPSTDLIDKQTILGTCKKFRVEKVKFSQSNEGINLNNPLIHLKKDLTSEDQNKIRSEILNNQNNIYNNKNFNNPILTSKNSISDFNFKNVNKNYNFLETLNINNNRTSNYNNLKSNEYNLMIFEGCDNLLFCTIILYGPDKAELKKLKKTLRKILLTARDLFLQQHLMYFFYSDVKNVNDAFQSGGNIHLDNEKPLLNNLDIIPNNISDISINSSMSSIPLFGKESIKIDSKINNHCYSTHGLKMNNNINLTNIFSCLSKLELEYKQIAKDFFFGFDRSLLEDKSKLSVVRLIITQGTFNNPGLLTDKLNPFHNNLPPILFEQNLLSDNYNYYQTENKQINKLNVPIMNNELPEKEILDSINSICDEPEELDLIYYSKDNDYDKPLGKLILDLCAESESKCDMCKRPKCNHFYYIYKKTGRLKIQLGQNQEDFSEKIMESINRETTDFNKINNYNKSEKEKNIYLNSNNNYNIDIFSYGVCKICKKVVTPLIKLTREIFNFSVAKFFKFMLYNHEVKNRSDIKIEFNLKKHYLAENTCSHFLNKDISRIFISKLGTIRFTYENCPHYIIETSPIHELKNKKHYGDILEEYIVDSRKKSLELIDILKNNFLVFMDELNSDFYKASITLNLSNNINNLNNHLLITQVSNNNQNTNGNLNNYEKKEIKEYAEKTFRICQKYYNVLIDINNFIELVLIPFKFKNYLKSVSIVKKIYFRIVQIKIIQDRNWMMIRRIKRFINNHLENKNYKPNNTPNFNSVNNNTNPNAVNNNDINDDISIISPDQKSPFSSGLKENNNLSKDYISQLNHGLAQNLNNSNLNTLLNVNSETNTNAANTPVLNQKSNTCPTNLLNSNNIQINELNVTKSIAKLEENLNPNLNLGKQNTSNNFQANKENVILKENQSVNDSIIPPSINIQPSSTLINIDDDNISRIQKPCNIINIEAKDSYKHVLSSISLFDETNHKYFSTDISFNDIASIISYTLTSDKYREYISPSNRLKLLDIKCKRQKKFKDPKDDLNHSNINGPIFNRLNIQNENVDKNENKYGYSFLTSQDMEVYDTSLLFDQEKNNYSYQNLEKCKIYQQLETELLSDDKSQFNYSFTNSNLMNLLISLNMPIEYVNSYNSTSGNSFYKKSKNTSKSLLNNLSLNLNKNPNITNEKENSNISNNLNQNLSNISNTHDINNTVINNPINKDILQNNLNTSTPSANFNNVKNSQNRNLNDIEISNNNMNHNNNYLNPQNTTYKTSVINSGNQYSPEEKILLTGDNIKIAIEELENMKKDLKGYKYQNVPNIDNKIKTKKKKIEMQESSSQMDIDVCVYYPRQFEALRITYCATYNDFILSVRNIFVDF